MIIKQHLSELTASLIVGGICCLAEAASMSPFTQFLVENISMGALIVFFVWTSWEREKRLADRITHLEATTPQLLERTITALDHHTEAMTETIARLEAGK